MGGVATVGTARPPRAMGTELLLFPGKSKQSVQKETDHCIRVPRFPSPQRTPNRARLILAHGRIPALLR